MNIIHKNMRLLKIGRGIVTLEGTHNSFTSSLKLDTIKKDRFYSYGEYRYYHACKVNCCFYAVHSKFTYFL